MSTLLDASAVLAYLHAEPGWQRVETALLDDAHIGSVNLAEVTGKLLERGTPAGDAAAALQALHLHVLPFDDTDAWQAGCLRLPTRNLGLSLGDGACLAQAQRHRLPVLTADRPWLALRDVLDLDIACIRDAN